MSSGTLSGPEIVEKGKRMQEVMNGRFDDHHGLGVDLHDQFDDLLNVTGVNKTTTDLSECSMV